MLLCECVTRRQRTAVGLFRFHRARDGWVFPLDPHFVWRECPWCDRLLPSTSCARDAAEEERRDHGQADGEDGG